LRSGHQRPTDGQHLLLAAGQRAGFLCLAFLQAREEAVHPLEVGLHLCLVLARERAHLEVLVDRHPAEDTAALGRLADPELDDLMWPAVIDAVAAQLDVALAWLELARDRPQRRGLAGAIRT